MELATKIILTNVGCVFITCFWLVYAYGTSNFRMNNAAWTYVYSVWVLLSIIIVPFYFIWF